MSGLYVFSKVFWLLFSPPSLLVILLAAGLVLGFCKPEGLRRFGRRLLGLSAAALVAISALPMGEWLLTPLENRFPVPDLPQKVYGIVVLGGTENEAVAFHRGQPSINYAGERLIQFTKLAREHPEAKLVFAGGTGRMKEGDLPVTESVVAKGLLQAMGMNRKVVYESTSKNTFQNAANAAKLLGDEIRQPWVLVTSAFHLSRAVGVFEQQGWNVIPYPAGYFTTGTYDTLIKFDVTRNLGQLHMAVHEWLGHIAYYLMGRMDSFFPGPVRE
ncbi:MAG: YdcF family protein [Alphaproteobacteria bacterium]|nr:YdcF family protein [Alphaproteobacteria bacterium]